MTHEPSRTVREKRLSQLLVPEMWASLAIIVIWLAVLVVAISGPDIVTNNGVGDIGEHSTIPSVVLVAPFAFLATWVVAKYGFRHDRETD